MAQVRNEFSQPAYDYKRHTLLLNIDHEVSVGYIRMPLHLRINEDLTIADDQTTVLYLTIESGHAAISIMAGKQNVYHTTFSAYMTRKKQGVSQIKYLNKKGKSRAGSRVRLAKTLVFFEEINTTLVKLLAQHDIKRIALDCSTTLIPYLHSSKVPCPFDKKDPRLYKIPLHIPQSNFTNLDKVIKKLMAPTLFYNDKHAEVVTSLAWA